MEASPLNGSRGRRLTGPAAAAGAAAALAALCVVAVVVSQAGSSGVSLLVGGRQTAYVVLPARPARGFQGLDFMTGYLGDLPESTGNPDGYLADFPPDGMAEACGAGACDPEKGCDDEAFFACMRQLRSRTTRLDLESGPLGDYPVNDNLIGALGEFPVSENSVGPLGELPEDDNLIGALGAFPEDTKAADCGLGACDPATGCDDAAFFACMYMKAQRARVQQAAQARYRLGYGRRV